MWYSTNIIHTRVIVYRGITRCTIHFYYNFIMLLYYNIMCTSGVLQIRKPRQTRLDNYYYS